MRLKLTQFRTSLDAPESELPGLVAAYLKLPAEAIKDLELLRKSLDARYKEPSFVYTLVFEIELSSHELDSLLQTHPDLMTQPPKASPRIISPAGTQFKQRPVIVGAGPAGLFAGLKLALAGGRPIILERGDSLAERIARIDRFWKQGQLDPESNIQFGIGGAGTFSDGKLTTRIKDPRVAEILETLVRLGGPPEIKYWQYPHIGTDLLREVIANLERTILDRGGEFHFRSRLSDFSLRDGRPESVTLEDGRRLETGLLILATGNSARDLYRLLAEKGLRLAAKPFAVGLRIEHPQDLIDRAQYGRWAGHPKLGPAEYHLTFKHGASGRGVYSFCMCPGGMVVGATSIPDGVVTNGMSYHARNSGVANAALIVTVSERDYGTGSPLAGMEFQQRLENQAYVLGGSNFFAPVQRVGDFLQKVPSGGFSALRPSYAPGYTPADLNQLLPAAISAALRDGIQYFNRMVKGFDWPDAVLTGVETRTSAPVRILRDERFQAEGHPGIIPVGEGAGYAGGIISSALDGWKAAEAILGG